MSLAQTYPNAIVQDDFVYFISLEAFKNLPNDSVIDVGCTERMSAPKSAIEKNLANIGILLVDQVNIEQHQLSIDIKDKMPNIPFEDKARFVFCSSFSKDKNKLFMEFRDYWIDEKPRIFKNTKVRFQKDGQTVMEMDI